MKRRVFAILLIAIMALILTTPIAAVSYQEAQEGNTVFRKVYLEQLKRQFPPPEEVEVIYSDERHESAIMAVNYYPINPNEKGITSGVSEIEVYPQAFELRKEDNLISTVLHEYNHVRVFSRSEIIDDNKDYFQGSKSFNLKWKDLYDRSRYENETLTGEEVSDIAFNQTIRVFIRSHFSEMLAIEEEIHLSETGVLTPSKEWQNSRYKRYVHHFLEMYAALNVLEAEETFKEVLTQKFYRPWFGQEVENYSFKKALYGFSP